ncbi:WecB/TagA/CpsF family glycosyltransferase [Caulobacter sp. 1776]|uniref:WecB/TagA/CpsF family glycosyltransferase n=1 Tax=Caulobacter sp. 1776 TaxID=3156420 RepID=UPI00339617A7
MSVQEEQSVAAPIAPRRPYRLTRRPEERVHVLGGTMDLVRPEEVFHFVSGKLDARQSVIVANHNLHSLYLVGQDHQIGEFYKEADLIEVDSVPLIFWARLVGRASRRFHRCTYLDWRDDFWALATEKAWKVFFVGGAPGVAEQAIARIRQDWPAVQIASHHGYFDVRNGSAENTAVVEAIRDYAPDIVLVGMGMPRQEIWTLENHKAYGPAATFTVGGAFDYEAGVQKPAPRWMGPMGMEWLFRLMADPQRLFSRYCIEPWSLIGPACSDLSRAVSRRVTEGDWRAAEAARWEQMRARNEAAR